MFCAVLAINVCWLWNIFIQQSTILISGFRTRSYKLSKKNKLIYLCNSGCEPNRANRSKASGNKTLFCVPARDIRVSSLAPNHATRLVCRHTLSQLLTRHLFGSCLKRSAMASWSQTASWRHDGVGCRESSASAGPRIFTALLTKGQGN